MKDSWCDPVIGNGIPNDFDVSEVLLALLPNSSSVTGTARDIAEGFPDLSGLGYGDLVTGVNSDRDLGLVILVPNCDVFDLC